MEYKKKEEKVKAIQFKRNNIKKAIDFTEGRLDNVGMPRCPDGIMTGLIKNSEETYSVTENDYIVKNSNGVFYPINPRVFHKTYEALNN